MSDEIYAELVILSDTLTPDQVNSCLDMKYDKSHLKGDTIQPSTIRTKRNAWIIYSRVPRNTPLQAHIEDLLDRVSPIIQKIRNIADQPNVEVEFNCVVSTIDRPAMFFTKEQVAAICKMGASIDIDLYLQPRQQAKLKTNPT
ncbi:DUF4279 domain-containing protein [Chloroflexota bacterium]